ncbi:hypothetical protein NKG05_07575 [Oerskovia sp. M15]
MARLAVVVPVNDEEELLPRCLAALEVAVGALRTERPSVQVAVVVVLDACADGSTAIARASTSTVVETSHQNVGAARAAGSWSPSPPGVGATRRTPGSRAPTRTPRSRRTG